MTDQQFNNLPNFAQAEIIQLRTALKNATDELAAVGDKRETRIRWGYDFPGEAFGYINEMETISFCLGNHKKRTFLRIRLKEGGECVNINADGGVSIEPYSTNDFNVRLRP